jgi:nucleoside-diphosphate-sugar epimerase
MRPEYCEIYEGKTILITGGAGYIGSALAQAFSNINCNLKLLFSSSRNSWEPKLNKANVSFIYGDVSNQKIWAAILDEVDYVYHLAAVEGSNDLKNEIEVNSISMLYLLDACYSKKQFPKIIYASSANIFGNVRTNPVNETFPDYPASTWSVHKLLAEQYLRFYYKKYKINSVILRLSNVYGPVPNGNVNNRVVLNKIIDIGLNGETLNLYKNHSCVRDYIYIDDVIRAFLFAGGIKDASCEGQFYVIGSQEGYMISDVLKLIAKKVSDKMCKEVKIKMDETVTLEPMAMRNFISDTSLFNKTTGWHSIITLEKGIENTVNTLFGI